MSSSQTSEALAKALLDLSRKCEELRQQKGSKKEGTVTSEADPKIRKDSLDQLKTTLLPAARNLLVEFFEALDLPPKKSTSPNPQFNNALDIVPRLSTALVNLSLSANTLGPEDEKYGLNDQNSGVLKKFRCENLQKEVVGLISISLSDVFDELSDLISSGEFTNSGDDEEPIQPHASIATLEDSFDHILHLMDSSDFGILQSIWHEGEEEVDNLLAVINREIHSAKYLDPLDDQDFSLKVTPRLIKLLEQCSPVVKSCRTFFKKIASTDLFTFSEKLPSAELESIVHHADGIKQSLRLIVHCFSTAALLQDVELARGTPFHFSQLKKSVEETLEFITSHMTPSDHTAKVDEVMDKLFGPFKSSFYPAISELESDFSQFEASI